MVISADNKVCITKWNYNKSVLMIPTALGKEPQTEEERWNKTENERTGRYTTPVSGKSKQKTGLV